MLGLERPGTRPCAAAAPTSRRSPRRPATDCADASRAHSTGPARHATARWVRAALARCGGKSPGCMVAIRLRRVEMRRHDMQDIGAVPVRHPMRRRSRRFRAVVADRRRRRGGLADQCRAAAVGRGTIRDRRHRRAGRDSERRGGRACAGRRGHCALLCRRSARFRRRSAHRLMWRRSCRTRTRRLPAHRRPAAAASELPAAGSSAACAGRTAKLGRVLSGTWCRRRSTAVAGVQVTSAS